jgi:transcriptional regulator with XRE-family HTH domain
MVKKEKPHQFLILIGENIAKYRKKRKLSMEQFGLEVGLTGAHIHRIENGYNITLMTILKISIALGVEPHKLLQVGYVLDKDELQLLTKPKPKINKSNKK